MKEWYDNHVPPFSHWQGWVHMILKQKSRRQRLKCPQHYLQEGGYEDALAILLTRLYFLIFLLT
jgi:hypothetical protein